ncbi:hypothetical protein rosag_34940 [Roseisolibacter agri]|uniref:histidine kinase n=1 Tax=Roseisolibacter agri TaxID=2014610 RepID=A0AA37V7R6_9BACT|nr:hypothetical protein rosag_34940 [Roseisolibacter agri]
MRYLVHYVEDVTERVHAEAERARLVAALAAERGQLRAALLQAMTPMALLVGPEHRLELVNDAYKRVSGGRDVTGLTYREAFPELEGQPFFDIQDRVYATGEPWAATAVPVRYDRLGAGLEDAYFDLRYEPVRDAEGRVFALLSYGVDVTEQTRAHLAAERERQRLAAVLEHLPVGVTFAEAPAGRHSVSNPAAVAIWGVVPASPEVAAYSRDFVGFRPGPGAPGSPEEAARRIASHEWPLARALAQGEVVQDELVEIERPDGARRLVSLSAAPVRDADGRVDGALVTSVDVTERERLLAESEAARARVTAVLESIGDAFYAVDAEFRFTYVNRRAEALWQRCREDLIGRHYWSEFPAAVGSESYRMHHQVMSERRPVHYETISPLTDLWIDVSIYPEAGGGLACYFRDITARKTAEAAREAAVARAEGARAEAEQANRGKSEFLAVMSHELRTPLNAIGGYAELIELGIHGPVTEAQRTALARIQQSQRHLLGLIAGVLDYSRVEAGAVTYRLADVPVGEAVAEAEALVAPQLRAKGLGYAWSGAPPELHMRADREKLQQILLNLLGNAVKFTRPRDGVPGRIEVACTVDEERVHLHVRDTGVGIAPEQLERIFEPFVQADQRLTRAQEGVGLGLAISRDLARGMGGDLTAASVPGVGSTFSLTLPRA